jgi:hypothetical protein
MPTEHFNRLKLCGLNVENFESSAFSPLLLRSSKKIIRKTNLGSVPSFLVKKVKNLVLLKILCKPTPVVTFVPWVLKESASIRGHPRTIPILHLHNIAPPAPI